MMKDSEGNVWYQLSISIGCGGCENNTTVFSDHTCEVCGRMLCGLCGRYCSWHRKDIVKQETAKMVEHINNLISEHREENTLCHEDCWCWDLQALARQWVEEYELMEV